MILPLAKYNWLWLKYFHCFWYQFTTAIETTASYFACGSIKMCTYYILYCLWIGRVGIIIILNQDVMYSFPCNLGIVVALTYIHMCMCTYIPCCQCQFDNSHTCTFTWKYHTMASFVASVILRWCFQRSRLALFFCSMYGCGMHNLTTLSPGLE